MISNEYKKILQQLNGVGNFGKRAKIPKYLDTVINKLKPNSILDFGCGTGALISKLRENYSKIRVEGYDPGNGNYLDQFKGQKFDLLISTDVLEHIEPEFLDDTLKFLKSKADNFYHLIALAPSSVTLPDGRNAHLILESKEWWRCKFTNENCSIMLEHHMNHIKNNKTVNKFFISGSYRLTY